MGCFGIGAQAVVIGIVFELHVGDPYIAAFVGDRVPGNPVLQASW